MRQIDATISLSWWGGFARGAFALILALATVPAALAVVVPRDEDSELRRLAVSDPALYPPIDVEPIDAAGKRLDPGVRFAWSDFKASNAGGGGKSGGGWSALIDRRSGLLHLAEGAGVPFVPGYGNDLELRDVASYLKGRAGADLDTLERLAREFLRRYGPLLGIDGYELRLDLGVSGRYADYLWIVELDVFLDGLQLEDARVFFHVNNGNLVQFGSERLPRPGTPVPPVRLEAQEAIDRLEAHVGGFDEQDWFLGRGRLRLVVTRGHDDGDDSDSDDSDSDDSDSDDSDSDDSDSDDSDLGEGYALLPVWEFVFRRGEEAPTWRARIDATDGAVVELIDANDYAQVTGGYWPISWRVGGVEQPQVVTGWPFVDVNPLGATSNTSGIYAWDGNPQTARHLGPYVNVDDQCTGAPGTAGSGAGGDIAFGEILVPNAPGDCQDQNGVNDNSPSARQQFWHTNKIMEKARSFFPANAWVSSQLGVNVNINSSCNAFWNGATTNFYRSGSGCGNTGEDAGVSMHEWGHGWDQNDGNGSSLENGTGETIGDFTAALQTLDSCVGQGFLGGNCGGYGNACNACDGVRDIDWGDHAQNVPWTVEAFTRLQCPCSQAFPGDTQCQGSYNGPCGINFAQGTNNKEGHCESYVSSGAVFDFANYDLRSGCGGRNAAFPDWNCPGAGGPYSLAGAFGVADRLWYLSSPLRNQAFTCLTGSTPWTSHGCNAGSNWRAMRLVDDDDGNLANGTPHSCQLAAAFDRHGISCTSDAAYNVCFRGCTQPAPPTLAAPGVGNNQLTLTWSPDTTPDVVDVFRNEAGCNFGFTKIADDVPFSALPFVDSDVANGTTYYYQVVRHPVGNEACGSAPSNCVSGTPVAGPSAEYVDGSATLVALPTDTDADGFVDNCEAGRIQVGIVNDGVGNLTNVRFTVTSPDAAVTVTTAMPVNVGNLAQSTQTTGTFDFDLGTAAAASCGQTLDFDVSVTADEMSGSNPDSFTHGPVEQDLVLTASRTDDFETGADGWTLGGGFARENVTAASGVWSVHSSSGQTDACETATSPVFQKGAGATSVTLAVRWDIEAFSGGSWWDKANVHAVRLSDGVHTVLNATGARPYNATASGGGLCHVNPDNGWADTNLAWGDATFDLSGLTAGESYRLEVNHNTDSLITGTGIWFDNVRWSNVSFQVCDAQSDVCVPCTPPAAPTGLTATAVVSNEIRLDWNAVAPAPASYRIYRSTTSGGPYALVGSVGGATLTFDDTGLTAGQTYYYVVRAFDVCESADSNEASETAFGDCTTPPTFGGLTSVAPISAGGSCGLRLSWSAGTNNCASDPLVYDVYRSTTPGFTPGPANLLASCVPDTFFDDTTVVGGTTYYYVVRAEDDEVGGGGACRDGNEDGNSTELSGMLSGGTTYIYKGAPDNAAEDFENPPWTVGSSATWNTSYVFTGGTSNDWVRVRACPGQSGSQIFRMGSPTNPNSCTANYSNNTDGITFPDPVGGEAGIRVPAGVTATTLRFWHQWQFGSNGGDFGALYLSSDLTPSYFYVGQAYLSGQTYNFNNDRFANSSPGYVSGGANYVQTVVDLAQFCNDNPAQFGGNDCAGRDLHVTFRGFANASQTRDGWFLDDVEVTAGGGTACSAAPGAAQFLTATATAGQNEIQWLNPASGGYGSTMIRWSSAGYPTDPTNGNLLVDQNDGLGAKGTATHGGLIDGTTYFYSAFVDSGTGEYSARRTVSARPFDTSGNVKWSYSTGASALTPPGIGSVYGVANDRALHSMATGSAGPGTWPATWQPLAMNGPAQARPPIVPVALGAATKVAFLGSQDGRVYAVDADTGQQLWSSPDLPPLGGLVQGAPAGSFAAFGGLDLLFAGTRHASADNQLHALAFADGTIAWSFTNSLAQGGDGSGIGVISSGPSLDFATGRLNFTSRTRAGGSQATVWCISMGSASTSLVWSRAIGDVDGAPVVLGGRLYVGTNSGEVHALDAATGADLWNAPFDAGDGPVKGYVFPRFGTSDLFFSTTTTTWSISDDGASPSLGWSVASIPSPSIPLVSFATPTAWVGGGDGRLYQLDFSGGSPAITSIVLGGGAAAVGSPALDIFANTAYVGTDAGRVYAVSLPLP